MFAHPRDMWRAGIAARRPGRPLTNQTRSAPSTYFRELRRFEHACVLQDSHCGGPRDGARRGLRSKQTRRQDGLAGDARRATSDVWPSQLDRDRRLGVSGQTSPGVETVVTQADQLAVVRSVLAQLSAVRHVRPKIYVDAELSHVDLADVPGIDQIPRGPRSTVPRVGSRRPPHAEIIDKLDAAGEKFRVLVLKTNMTLPYTSVFIELDCGYWSGAAQARLAENGRSRRNNYSNAASTGRPIQHEGAVAPSALSTVGAVS